MVLFWLAVIGGIRLYLFCYSVEEGKYARSLKAAGKSPW